MTRTIFAITAVLAALFADGAPGGNDLRDFVDGRAREDVITPKPW